MDVLSVTFIFSSFLAGLLMFLAPCTLPLVPSFLAFISGSKESDALSSLGMRRQIIRNASAFVIGFSVVFILFGISVGVMGATFGFLRDVLAQVGGVFIILFALLMLNVLHITPLTKEYRAHIPHFIKPGKVSSAFIIGTLFALGWTPCVGPILATILLLASTSGSVAVGTLLLTVFSVGLAVPFMLTAFFYSKAVHVITRYQHISRFITILGGAFLLMIGVLLLTDNFGLTVEYGYRFLDFLHIPRFLDFY